MTPRGFARCRNSIVTLACLSAQGVAIWSIGLVDPVQARQGNAATEVPAPENGRDATATLGKTDLDECESRENACPPSTDSGYVGGVVHAVRQPSAPWQVSLWSFKFTDYTAAEYRAKAEWMRRHKCGGTLISPDWVLTAAHCVTGDLADHPFKARLGATSLTDPAGRLFDVVQKVVHPRYDPELKKHDVALLRINSVSLPQVSPVRLSGTSGFAFVSPALPALVYGFGKTYAPDKTRIADASAILLAGFVSVLDRGRCEDDYRHWPGRITSLVFCASSSKTDSCQGDSGGPLMAKDARGAVQIGIVSWGDGCSMPDHPGVYVNVEKYLTWIWKVTGGKAGRPTLPVARN
jgi:hypothetical protein